MARIIDLTLPVRHGMRGVAIEKLPTVNEHGWNSRLLHLYSHCGTHMDTVGGKVLWLFIAIFSADITISPSWAACVDIGGHHAGAVSGTMNMAGNLGSFVTALAFPYLLAWTGNVHVFF